MAVREFSRSLGRLSRSTRLNPLFPIKPVSLSKVQSVIIYDSIKTKPASTDVVGVQSAHYSTVPESIRKKQEQYQKNLDCEVYLAGGTPDKILYYGTVLGVAVSFCFSMEFISHYWYIK